MKNKTTMTMLSAAMLVWALGACTPDVSTSGNSVTVKVDNPQENGAKIVKLEVINDDIIRVQASAESALPRKKESLIIVPQHAQVDFSVEENDSIVRISTKKVAAVVNRQSGRIEFLKDGKLVLAGTKTDGMTFKPFVVPEREIGVGTLSDKERNGWSWHLQFDSPDDEAFYGLGQHQTQDYNYKGVNEELFQYNTKVSVPFVVSNKGYGLLWDSYSYCRWGNPNEYLQLNRAFTLYDKDGNQGGLTGTYVDAEGNELVRQEDSIYFEFAVPNQNKFKTGPMGLDNLPQGFKLDGANVVYEGYIQAPQTYNYRFILYYAGYMKVMIGGEEVVAERWRTAWNPNAWKFNCELKEGEKTPIRIEWKPDGGESYCGLRAAVPQTEEEQGRLSVWSEMSRDMDFYFIAGDNMDKVISGYRTLTGKAPVYPKWVLGFWQSRERYTSSNDIESVLSEFRKRHIPVDNIVQDWNYWKLDSWGDHTFETSRFPNPQAMLDSVHQMGGRFMISVWPKFY